MSVFSIFSVTFLLSNITIHLLLLVIPLKLDSETALDADEAEHLKLSFDGLAHFYPVDLYPENIVASKGLLTAFRRLQL